MMNKISVEERISRMTVKDLYSAMVKEGCSLKDLEKRALASLSEITDYWGDVLAGQRDLGEDVGMASGRLGELITGKPRPDVRGEGYYRHLNAQRIRMANRNMQARLKLLRAIENSKMDVSGIGNALFGKPGQ